MVTHPPLTCGYLALSYRTLPILPQVSGSCIFSGMPFHCAATRFERDYMVPKAPSTAAGIHCPECAANGTLIYDHCKNHPHWVDVDALGKLTLARTRTRTLTLTLTLALAPALALTLTLNPNQVSTPRPRPASTIRTRTSLELQP